MDGSSRAARSVPRMLLVALCLAAGVLALSTSAARAGGWTLVSCTNPDGTPAPVDGWTPGVWAGTPVTGSGAVDGCAAGGALSAISGGSAPAFTGPEWVFTAPGGDTIAGGTIDADFTAPQGQAWISTPQPAFDAGDVIAGCGTPGSCPPAGAFAISHPGGTTLFAPAICTTLAAPACEAGALNAQVDIKAADIELADSSVPAASGVSGSLVAGRARGVATLRMLASDPGAAGGSGPGVYAVSVSIDGTSVYVGPPNPAKPVCPSVGTDPATGHLMFDHAQPCPPTARVAIPVDTSSLADGRHALTVVVTDAGGDTGTVVDNRTFTTFNPLVSPARPPGTVATRLTVGFDGASPAVAVHSVSARRLPRNGRVSLECLASAGAQCPRLTRRAAAVARVGRLWTALKALRFASGDRLRITIAAPGRPSERIQYRIKQNGLPAQRLLADGPPLRVSSGRPRHHRGSSTGGPHRPHAGSHRLAVVRQPSAY
jgi:hypothetical protein